MGEAQTKAPAKDRIVADQELRVARMKPDDPALPAARRLLDAVRRELEKRRVLDLTPKTD